MKQADKPKDKFDKEKPEKEVQKPEDKPGIVQPMIDELRRSPKDAPQPPKAPPRGPVHPPEPEPAELDQDSGGGYNPDHTYPQT